MRCEGAPRGTSGRFLVSKARSAALSLLRNRQSARQRELTFATLCSLPAMPDAVLEREELATHVRKAIACLPPRQQMAVGLRILEGLSYKVIAARMAISTRTLSTTWRPGSRSSGNSLLRTRRTGVCGGSPEMAERDRGFLRVASSMG